MLPYSEAKEAHLVASLLKHYDLVYPLFGNHEVISVYFGGGTPSLLSEKALASLLQKLDLDPSVECTLEANPEDITKERVFFYKEMGINRISLGVQSFLKKELIRLGRTTTPSEQQRAIETIATFIPNLSIDLIYEQFDQKVEDLIYSLDSLKNLPLTHLSVYNLLIEPPSLFYKQGLHQKKGFPSEEEAIQMHEALLEKTKLMNFSQYEISAFAKEGFASVHNCGYWTGRDFYGFGPSAFSYFNGRRFQMTKSLDHYATSVQAGIEPIVFCEERSQEEQQKEIFGLHLRLNSGVPKHAYFLSETFLSQIHLLIKQGLLEENEDVYRLTDQGRLVYDRVQEALL